MWTSRNRLLSLSNTPSFFFWEILFHLSLSRFTFICSFSHLQTWPTEFRLTSLRNIYYHLPSRRSRPGQEMTHCGLPVSVQLYGHAISKNETKKNTPKKTASSFSLLFTLLTRQDLQPRYGPRVISRGITDRTKSLSLSSDYFFATKKTTPTILSRQRQSIN